MNTQTCFRSILKPKEDVSSKIPVVTGAEILARKDEASEPIHIESGARMAIVGDASRKSAFCEWLAGYTQPPGGRIEFWLGAAALGSAPLRKRHSAILGRAPATYGETIQDAVLFRASNVAKKALYGFIERFYSPSLKARMSPRNPLLDREGRHVPLRSLTAREQLEVAQINVMLQRTALVVFDLSSAFFRKALAEGFRPARVLLESGKTILAILPSPCELVGNDADMVEWAAETMAFAFTGMIKV
ncbi:MAG: hypothetical protein HYW49_08340 [Deltaproteobacteria bacterium]|nr:hypothetical protein [Deltaproteobacteria bacterium]